jgi:ferredoxin
MEQKKTIAQTSAAAIVAGLKKAGIDFVATCPTRKCSK